MLIVYKYAFSSIYLNVNKVVRRKKRERIQLLLINTLNRRNINGYFKIVFINLKTI